MKILKKLLFIMLVVTLSFTSPFATAFAYTIEVTPDDGEDPDDQDPDDEGDTDTDKKDDKDDKDEPDVPVTSGNITYEGLNYYVDVEKNEAVLLGTDVSGMTELKVPDSINYGEKIVPVTEIEEYAFFESELKKLTLGSNVKTIKEGAFAFSSKLETVTANLKLNTIDTGAFMYCEKLKTFSVSKDAELYIIAYGAFAGTALTSFTIPDSTSFIGPASFANCEALTGVYIGSNCDSIGSGSFAGCNALDSITVSKSNYYFKVENGCIYSADGKILISAAGAKGEVTVADKTEIISECAFEDNKNVTSVVLPKTTREICKKAFLNAINIETVKGSGIKAIRADAFSGCKSLKKFTIPAATTVIEGNPFKYCPSLTGLKISKKNTSFKIVRGILSTYDRKTIISVPAAGGNITLASKTRYIGEFAFCGNTAITGITFNKKMVQVKSAAFYDCTGLTKVTIQSRSVNFTAPSTLTQDGEEYYCRIFENCSDGLTVSIPSGGDSESEGSIEYYIRKHCSNGVTITNT